MHSRYTPLILSSMILLLAVGTSQPGHAQPQADPAPPVLLADSGPLLREVEPALQRFVDQLERYPGQASSINVRLTPDTTTGYLWIDLDAGFLPPNLTEFNEDFGAKVLEVVREASDYIWGSIDLKMIDARIGGRDINEIFPPERLKPRKNSQHVDTPVKGLVVINPSHGLFLNHKSKSWEHQRPEPYAGTTDHFEDTVTPLYAKTLESLLKTRSIGLLTAIRHTRDLDNATVDPDSNHKWGDLGARYYAKRILPDEGESIWNRFPNGKPNREHLREYDEDIATRPRFANHFNAEAFISLHTDGAANASARGTTIYTNSDAGSQQLARNIQCYMREQITQRSDYKDYVIRPGMMPGTDKGEVRDANMPTALIEIGFHTNMEDSAALRDATFRYAAMRGVEKGYRTYMKGETDCKPLRITSIPAITSPYNVKFDVPITLEGTPVALITVTSEPVVCPEGWSCRTRTETAFGLTNNQIMQRFRCNADATQPAGTFTWKTTVKDGDGVETAAFEHTTHCKPG